MADIEIEETKTVIITTEKENQLETNPIEVLNEVIYFSLYSKFSSYYILT